MDTKSAYYTSYLFPAILALLSFCNAAAQSRISVSLDFAVTHDIDKVHDEKQNLLVPPLPGLAGGLLIQKELEKKIYLESGVLLKGYTNGLYYKHGWYAHGSDSFTALIIPLRVGYRIGISHGFFLTPVLGNSIGINTLRYLGSGRSIGRFLTTTDTLHYHAYEDGDVNRFFWLLEPRLSIGKTMGNHFLLSVTCARSFGFMKTHHRDITYTLNNSAPTNAQYISKGDFRSIGINVTYRFHRI